MTARQARFDGRRWLRGVRALACCALAAGLGVAAVGAWATELRFGLLADAPPHQVWPAGGTPGGADLELLEAVAAPLCLTVRPIRYDAAARLEADLRAGRLDIAGSMRRSPERDAALAFTVPYGRLRHGLLARVELPLAALAPDLAGRSIAVVAGSPAEAGADRLFPLAPRVVVADLAEAIDAVAGGRADATLQPLPALIEQVERRRLDGLQVARSFELPDGGLHFALPPQHAELAAALGHAIEALPAGRFDALLAHWSARPALLRLAPAEAPAAAPAAVAALAARAPLRAALVGGDRPFAFVGDRGQPAGLSVDVLDAVLRRLGLPPAQWMQIEAQALPEALREGRVDLVVGLDESAAWVDVLRFVGPIVDHPVVLVARRDAGAFDLTQLAGRRLALPPAHPARPLVEARHAAIELVACGTLTQCIDAVARGDAEATLTDVVSAAIAQAERPRGEVQIAGSVEALVRTQAIGVAVRHAEFVPLFKGALDAVVASELPALRKRWFGRPPPAEVARRVLWQAAPWAAGVLALLGAAWWAHSRRLRREIRRTRDAQTAAERARLASERFTTFLAHEVRNSLHSVIAGTELLRSARQVTPTIVGSLGESARSTLGLLNNLLDRDRLEAGRLRLHLEPARLEPLLRSVAVEMLPAALAKRLALQTIAPASDPLLQMDTLRVQQVLRNLIANAVKYSEAGEITVEAQVHPQPDEPPRCRVELSVRDQGPGIAPAQRERLFERYATGDGPGASASGTGLGLALCRDLARLMGGELRIDSAPGRGTTATLCWVAPLAPEVAPAAAAPTDGRRLLLVEDAEVYAMLLERALDQHGIAVQPAASAARARELLATQSFDLVLSDLHLGDGDAFEVLAAAGRAQPRPVLAVMSAEIDEAVATRLRDAGAQAVFKKSGDVALLARQLLQHPALQAVAAA